ncbi:hypothetical protein [Hymenobacter sp. UYP22]|uniref:hypothetical protein n=1 Tax=Hymenobacter sp. UYP22 TaxID=3156348 RepID=UPI0033998400
MSVSNEAAHYPGLLPCTARELYSESAHPDAHRHFTKLWRTTGVNLSVSFLDNPE